MEVSYKRRAAIIITTVAGVNFLNVMGFRILTVALPTIVEGLGLSTELLLWPALIYACAVAAPSSSPAYLRILLAAESLSWLGACCT
ncbi:hypothetical protein L207DRAFT_462485 [Hyaloscypha variabilis F]|uniref:Major facilitator superfamily (MFS) profile domain-containing protein n=1 Tax=Hyaloscypha variabilis (strain UAMH 11265 / GT02V1 / F) TaxID=1149755 RepID=A0A2J6RHP9_HYAVF|nr:hypothetical protein L207DRAFT_462485 [Hyaloscypha variabilis F]